MLSGQARHDVQCRSPSTADRLLDRGCPNKRIKKKGGPGRYLYGAPDDARDANNGASLSESAARAVIG
ncbi:hypothetical protein PAAG_12534 [Paracoccidioides lutzii Pb01]|uniref:Uncharacterized protein n=1 Tax=Paracoccidioides lutzii (strain ATCC MYA-826 / Pb01) TaxID=502779 RepID=A0A0A2UZ07_PARBA|nr:hypothetical protein PAAG_12534 [Paracoccidioides lutzii Pb01]KGQ00806.1 hypothetical protein PAAG_12534 [Paracoccidioides lutzii Pb01]